MRKWRAGRWTRPAVFLNLLELLQSSSSADVMFKISRNSTGCLNGRQKLRWTPWNCQRAPRLAMLSCCHGISLHSRGGVSPVASRGTMRSCSTTVASSTLVCSSSHIRCRLLATTEIDGSCFTEAMACTSTSGLRKPRSKLVSRWKWCSDSLEGMAVAAMLISSPNITWRQLDGLEPLDAHKGVTGARHERRCDATLQAIVLLVFLIIHCA